jgi:hypothetical protein
MTKDDVISIAREIWGDDSGKPWGESTLLHLERFAALVAAAEREACAALCSEVAAGRDADAIEEAILARGEK